MCVFGWYFSFPGGLGYFKLKSYRIKIIFKMGLNLIDSEVFDCAEAMK
jgi:hypothetical protein